MAKFKKSNHTITPILDTDVDYENNQDMGGNRITNAADAALFDDYITEHDFDNHLHPDITDEHTHTVWEPHTHPYADITHSHSNMDSSQGYTGWQEMPGGTMMMWGVTEPFRIDRHATNDPGDSDYLSSYDHMYLDKSVTFPNGGFDTTCLSFQSTIINADGNSVGSTTGWPYGGAGNHRKEMAEFIWPRGGSDYRVHCYKDCRKTTDSQIGILSMNPTHAVTRVARIMTTLGYSEAYNKPLYTVLGDAELWYSPDGGIYRPFSTVSTPGWTYLSKLADEHIYWPAYGVSDENMNRIRLMWLAFGK